MGKIVEINGPIVTADLPEVAISEEVKIGRLGLIGEVIGREGPLAVVQVHESTESLRPGEEVAALGRPMSVELGPGLLGQIFDGVQRPLMAIVREGGDRVARGVGIPSLDRGRTWSFEPTGTLTVGQKIEPGAVLGTVQENPSFTHRILVPPTVGGELTALAQAGAYTVDRTVAQVRDASGHAHEIRLYQSWPVRVPRPYRSRDHAVAPLFTGQRILDTFFPLVRGGKAAVPGPFGSGKTVLLEQIARWSNADIMIYVGCGERGNELVGMLEEFPKLRDPHTDRPLMERTLLVANTSNMPVVAREASIYSGVTIAEYFRDQGYDVVMVADSTSRWAEALREVAGRLGHMPVEEGYPAYLASRLSAFYERAGRVEPLLGGRGSVTLIGSVSPPGGDFSEPVTNHTKEIIQTFWALSKDLADARHYPAVDWNGSFSGYVSTVSPWWDEHIHAGWKEKRAESLELLARADELTRILNLVGPEALSPTQRWMLEAAGLFKDAVLQQSALDPADSYCSPEKQFALLDMVLDIYHQGRDVLALGAPVQELLDMRVLGRARRIKAVYASDQIDGLRGFDNEIREAFGALRAEYQQAERQPT